MRTAPRDEDRLERQAKSLTPEEATHRIEALRQVYLEGYITRTGLEALTRNIKARQRQS